MADNIGDMFVQAYKYEDRLLINPGSATGAYGTMNASAGPSFVLMDINGGKVRPDVGWELMGPQTLH
jgi:predicted phosphodiesterase